MSFGPTLRFFVTIVGFLLSLLASRVARADQTPCEAVAARLGASPALVTVKALEHTATGFVFRDQSSVYVAAVVVDVDRPWTDIEVIDATGGHHVAHVVARDAASDLARLRVEPPIDAEPFMESEEPSNACMAVLARRPGAGLDLDILGLAAGARACTSDLASCWPLRCGNVACPWFLGDSPILGADGRIIALYRYGTPTHQTPLARLVALADNPSAFPNHGRSVILYGGMSAPLIEFSPSGGGWIGVGGALEARYHDILAVRLSLGLLLLPRQGQSCGEPPCGSGFRFTFDPSVGFHLRVGGPLHLAMAVTPSIALAMRLQAVTSPPEAPVFDSRAPTFQAAPAPGLAFNISIFELSARWKMNTDDLRQSTYQIAAGFTF